MGNEIFVVANWKMNMTLKGTAGFFDDLSRAGFPEDIPEELKIVICPPYTSLATAKSKTTSMPIALGAQNISHADKGTYTGEISGPMIRDFADYVIVGHSERRLNNHETDKEIAKKVTAAVRNNLRPILCVGENLHQKHAGHSAVVVRDQVEADLSLLSAEDLASVILAYEPLWAISSGDGEGETATPGEVAEMVEIIKSTISELYSGSQPRNLPVLYGGSVNPSNVKAFLDVPGISGFLVGGASLNPYKFSDIITRTIS